MEKTATPLSGANDTGLSNDPVIVGAGNISQAIYGPVEGKRAGNIRRIYHAIANKELPTFQMGGRHHARRSTLEKWIAAQEQGA